ncbi:MAG: hypothetical protein QXP81_09180 [Nitrososphaerota archaeon]
MVWTATYDAEFVIRVERPSLYVRVTGSPPECLSEVVTEPAAKVEAANGTVLVGPFYRDSAVKLAVVPKGGCELEGITATGLPGTYRASAINLWLTQDVAVQVRFRTSAEGGGAVATSATATTTTPVRDIGTQPQPPGTQLPQVPAELLAALLVPMGGAAAAVYVVRAVRISRVRRLLEIEAAQSIVRQWVRRGRTSSIVLGLLSSRSAREAYGVGELLRAAAKGTMHIDALNLYHRGSPFLLTNLAYEICNSDELLALHLAAHLVAAGLIPASVENKERLRAELARWAKLIREGRGRQVEEEARAFVRRIREDPAEVLISEKLREVEAERHPFVQELINAAYRELGLEVGLEVGVAPEAVLPPVEVQGTRPEEERPTPEPEVIEGLGPAVEPAPVPEAPPEPVTLPEPEVSVVELKGPRDLYELIKRGTHFVEEGFLPLQIVGGAALMAAMSGEGDVLGAMVEMVRSAGVRITPPDLGAEGVYYPAEIGAVESAVARLAGEEHLACVVADVVGGTPVHSKPGTIAEPDQGSIVVDTGVEEDVLALASVQRRKGLPVRIATYSRERALRLASLLGVRAVGVRGLPEAEAALLLEAVGPVEPRLFVALVGTSLLIPEIRVRLAPPVGRETLESAISPPSCHIVKGLVPIARALERIASGKRQRTVEKALEIELGERAADAMALLELRWLDPLREGVMEVEVLEPPAPEAGAGQPSERSEAQEEVERAVGPEELVDMAEQGLIAGAEADEVSIGRAAIEAARRGRESFSALIHSLEVVSVRRFEVAPGSEVRVELPPELQGLVLRAAGRHHLKCLARLIAPGSRPVERGGDAVVLDPLSWIAGRLALIWHGRGLPPNPELFLALVTTTVLLPCVLEALEKSKLDPLGTIEMMPDLTRIRCCHDVPPALRGQLASIIRETAVGADYAALREKYGELASAVLLRSALRKESPPGAEWVRIVYDGGYRVEIDGSAAPEKAVVILLNEDIYAPPLFPVSSDLPVDRPGEAGTVIRFSAENLRRAMRDLMEARRKTILVGFASYTRIGELREVAQVVECIVQLKRIAEQAAALRLPVNLCVAYPQVLMASGPEEVEEVLTDLLSGTGFEGIAQLARRYVTEGGPIRLGPDADRRLLRAARSLGLVE